MTSLARLKTDKTKENEGIWERWIHDVDLKIARFNNAAFTAFNREKLTPYREAIENGTFTLEDQTPITKEGIARFILVDWRGIEEDDEAKTVIPYSWEKALEFFNMEGMDDLMPFIVRIARSAERYRNKFVSDAAGN